MDAAEQSGSRPAPEPAPGEGKEPGQEAPRVGEERGRPAPDPPAAGQEAGSDPPPPPAWGDLEPAAVIEALIFAAGESLTLDRLAATTGLAPDQVREHLAALEERLQAQDRPYRLHRVGRGWRLLTKPEYHPFLARLKGIRKGEGLSRAALETLAVVAYRQPVMRAEIEDIRGVQCGPMLRALLERRLVRIAGRAQVPGRPLLYGTTRDFLDRFGLADLKELPTLREWKG